MLFRPFRRISITFPAYTVRTMTTIPPLARNFPDSTAVPSSYFRWPGIADSSTQTVRRILEENDRKYDIYEKARCE